MSFPEIIFGPCQRCGGRGADDPDASGADATPRDLVGNGLELKMFRDQALCPTCINDILNEEQSLIDAEKHADTEQFLSGAGFRKEIT